MRERDKDRERERDRQTKTGGKIHTKKKNREGEKTVTRKE